MRFEGIIHYNHMRELDLTNKVFKEQFYKFFTILKEGFIVLIFCTFLGLSAGIVYSTSLNPLFSITSEIAPKNTTSSTSSGDSYSIVSLFGIQTAGELDEIRSVMFSYRTAEKLWNNGYDSIIYSNNYDPVQEKYIVSPSNWNRFQAWILGYELNTEIGPPDLRDTIRSMMKSTISEFTGHLFLEGLSSNPELVKKIMLDIVVESDNLLKQEKKDEANKQIEFLNSQLGENLDSDVRSSLVESIKQQYLTIALLSNDLPYTIKMIEKPIISSNPVSPNLQFIYFFWSFLGFSLSFIYLFIRKYFF